MKTLWLWFVGSLFLAAWPCFSADLGVVTVVDGKARILRGTTWFKLAEGGAVREGDVVDAQDGAQVELELTDGGALSIIGPGALYAASVVPRDAKQTGTAEFMLTRGWLKLVARPSAMRIRIKTGVGTITAGDATLVARAGADSLEVFVETGLAKVSDGKTGPDGTSGDVKDGGFAAKLPGKSMVVSGRAPSQFVGAMPRDFMDALPMRAAKYKSGTIELSVEREATYVDAQPWLSGPYRAAFIKRFEPKLVDPGFRAAATANSKVTPEWASVQPPASTLPGSPSPVVKSVEAPKDKPAEPERTWRWPWEPGKK